MKLHIRLAILLISAALVPLLNGCGSDCPTVPQTSPMAGYWQGAANVAIPGFPLKFDVEIFIQERSGQLVSNGMLLIEVDVGALSGGAAGTPVTIAQRQNNVQTTLDGNTVSVTGLSADLSILSALGGGGGGIGGGLNRLPLALSGTLSEDKNSINGSMSVLFFPAPITLQKK